MTSTLVFKTNREAKIKSSELFELLKLGLGKEDLGELSSLHSGQGKQNTRNTSVKKPSCFHALGAEWGCRK